MDGGGDGRGLDVGLEHVYFKHELLLFLLLLVKSACLANFFFLLLLLFLGYHARCSLRISREKRWTTVVEALVLCFLLSVMLLRFLIFSTLGRVTRTDHDDSHI